MATKKAAKHVRHPKHAAHEEAEVVDVPLTTEEKLDGLIHFLKDHGIHYDGSRAPEEVGETGEEDGEGTEAE